MQLETTTANCYCSASRWNSNIRDNFLNHFVGSRSVTYLCMLLEPSRAILMCDKIIIAHYNEEEPANLIWIIV